MVQSCRDLFFKDSYDLHEKLDRNTSSNTNVLSYTSQNQSGQNNPLLAQNFMANPVYSNSFYPNFNSSKNQNSLMSDNFIVANSSLNNQLTSGRSVHEHSGHQEPSHLVYRGPRNTSTQKNILNNFNNTENPKFIEVLIKFQKKIY